MAIATVIKKGEDLIERELYEEAIAEFQLALKENQSSFKALIGKSIAHQRLNQMENALEDLEKALKVSKERSNRDNIAVSYFRLAIVFFHQQKLGKSLKLIKLAGHYGIKDPSYPIWNSKIVKKASKENVEEEEFETSATESHLQLSSSLSVPLPLPLSQSKPKMSYYQSNDRITIDFFYKNLSSPNIQFKPTTLAVEFKTATGSDVIFDYNLFAPIVPEESSFKLMSTKVEVTLKKKTPAKWSSLEGSGEEIQQSSNVNAQNSSSSPLLYPTSSKNKINWSNFTVEDDDKAAEAEDENAFFQQIYAGADDDTRRAMMKSFVESNGTALSTNWKETKDKKWEVNPPDDVVAKKW